MLSLPTIILLSLSDTLMFTPHPNAPFVRTRVHGKARSEIPKYPNHKVVGAGFTGKYYSYDDLYSVNRALGRASLRVTLARLVKRGYVEKISKNGVVSFGLASKGKEKLTSLFVIQESPRWDGKWRVVAAKKEMNDLAFAAIQKGIYVSPFPLVKYIPGAFVFETKKITGIESREFAQRAFKLNQLQNRYNTWVVRVARMGRSEREIRMLLGDYQKIIRDDPKLPISLLPPHWPAERAASVFRKLLERRFR